MNGRREADSSALITETIDPNEPGPGGEQERERPGIALTIAGHPDVARVGEVAHLALDRPNALSRTELGFSAPGVSDRYPLADPGMSRKALFLVPREDGAVVLTEAERGWLTADLRPLEPPHVFSREAIARGVVLTVGRVVLLLHAAPAHRRADATHGMLGESAALHALRRQIEAVAPLDVPVLIRGETGTGKELVARAIHAASTRSKGPYHAINIAAVHPALAASELFGHRRGAFTGAGVEHEGMFKRARGGTLFLDEVGETPSEVQGMLLRTLESGTIQPVGGDGEERCDVRLICATDADLSALVAAGALRAPMLYRLAGFELEVPPLRARRDDIGRLFFHFLREELTRVSARTKLDQRNARDAPWVPAEMVARLLLCDWPGNVRHLRNVARRIAITHRENDAAVVDDVFCKTLGEHAAPPAHRIEERPRARRRYPRDISEEDLARALGRNRWNMEATAEDLGISRGSLYTLVNGSGRFRKAKDVSREELLAAHGASGGDFERMAELLQVSSGGLRLRMKELDAGR